MTVGLTMGMIPKNRRLRERPGRDTSGWGRGEGEGDRRIFFEWRGGRSTNSREFRQRPHRARMKSALTGRSAAPPGPRHIWANRESLQDRCPARLGLGARRVALIWAAHPASGVAQLRSAARRAPLTRRGSRRDCPARRRTPHLAVPIPAQAQAGAAHAASEADQHRGRPAQAVGDDRDRRPTRAAARLGAVHDRPGRLHGDADLREGLARTGLGGRGRQRRRAPPGPAPPRGR